MRDTSFGFFAVALVFLCCFSRDASVAKEGYWVDPRMSLLSWEQRLLYARHKDELWRSDEPRLFKIALHGLIDEIGFHREGTPITEEQVKTFERACREKFNQSKSGHIRALLLQHSRAWCDPGSNDSATEQLLALWRSTREAGLRGAVMCEVLGNWPAMDIRQRNQFVEEAVAWITGNEEDVNLEYAVTAMAGFLRLPSVQGAIKGVSADGRQLLIRRLQGYLNASQPEVRHKALAAIMAVDPPRSKRIALDAMRAMPDERCALATLYFLHSHRELPPEWWNNPQGLRLLRLLIATKSYEASFGLHRDPYAIYEKLQGNESAARVGLSALVLCNSADRGRLIKTLNRRELHALEALHTGWRPSDYTNEDVRLLAQAGLSDRICELLLTAEPVEDVDHDGQ